jgi:hypothetical protein
VSAHEEIAAELRRLPGWGQTVFAAGCAERVAPVFRAFCQPDSRGVLEAGLRAVWAAAQGDGGQRDVEQAAAAVAALPEADEDDSNLPTYQAMKALSVLAYALETATDGGPEEAAEWASGAALDIRAEMDFILRHGADEAVVIDPANPPPAGELESAEVSAQRESLRPIAAEDRPNQSLVASIRRLSEDMAAQLERVLPEFARRRGWA